MKKREGKTTLNLLCFFPHPFLELIMLFCPSGAAPAALQRCAGGHPHLPQGLSEPHRLHGLSPAVSFKQNKKIKTKPSKAKQGININKTK